MPKGVISGTFNYVGGWQFLTTDAAETLCIVCLPPEEHFPEKITFYNGLTIKSGFYGSFKNCKITFFSEFIVT